jgi:hypothetical protein
MEEFKSFEEAFEPDPRWDHYVKGSRKFTFEDLYELAASIDLDLSVPEEICSKFNNTKTHAFDGAFSERKIKKLFGTLVDLESGKIIKSFKIDRSMWVFSGNSAFIEELADKLE